MRDDNQIPTAPARTKSGPRLPFSVRSRLHVNLTSSQKCTQCCCITAGMFVPSQTHGQHNGGCLRFYCTWPLPCTVSSGCHDMSLFCLFHGLAACSWCVVCPVSCGGEGDGWAFKAMGFPPSQMCKERPAQPYQMLPSLVFAAELSDSASVEQRQGGLQT